MQQQDPARPEINKSTTEQDSWQCSGQRSVLLMQGHGFGPWSGKILNAVQCHHKPKHSLQRVNVRLWLQHQPLGNQKVHLAQRKSCGQGVPTPLRSPSDPSIARSVSVPGEDHLPRADTFA